MKRVTAFNEETKFEKKVKQLREDTKISIFQIILTVEVSKIFFSFQQITK